MLKNTESFYMKAKEFQRKRAKIVSEYESKVESLKEYEGSEGYKKRMETLQKEHEDALSMLQDEYGKSLRLLIIGMEESLSRRKVNPPTNDQLNLIHLLKMRDKVSREELDRVFEMVKDNGIAVGVIQEVARSSGVLKNYEARCKEMSTSYAQKLLNDMKDRLDDWLKNDTKKAARIGAEHNMRMWGTSPAKPLPKTPLFEDIEGCYGLLAGIDQNELKAFSEAVNG